MSDCQHTDKTYIGTYEDWWDGDSDDLYECLGCGEKVWVYIGR